MRDFIKALVMKELISLGVVVSAILLITPHTVAQNNPSSPRAPSALPQVTSPDRYEKLLDRLAVERQSLAEESKRQFEIVKYVFEQERDSFQKLLEKALWVFGALFAGTASFISFVIVRIYGEQKSLRETFTRETKEEIEKLKIEYKHIHDDLRQDLSQLEQLEEEVKLKQNEISSFLSEQNKFKEKNICWLYGQQDITDASIIESLKQKGIKNVHEAILPSDGERKEYHYDAIVFSIGEVGNISGNFAAFLSELKSQGEPPLVVYTYLKGARDLCRSLDLMKKQCVVGSTQLQNRCLLRQRIVQLPVA